MNKAEQSLREEIVARCREMNAAGINQGTSGNISARFEDRMLITPSAVPYERLEAGMIASIALDDPDGAWEGPLTPSTEWRFHHALLRGRPDARAVVHAHPTCCTALAMARKEIPGLPLHDRGIRREQRPLFPATRLSARKNSPASSWRR